MSKARDLSDLPAGSGDININGGTIDNTTIGGTTPAAGTFTTFTSTGIDDNASSTAVTLDSSGNVGIGTTTPTSKLYLQGSTDGFLEIRMEPSADTDKVSIAFRNAANSSTRGFVLYDHSDESMSFRTNGSGEAMRIDSSGNVLVGKTSTTSALTTSGADIRPEGRMFMAREGANVLYLGRTTTNGSSITFYKDGTSVGTISVTGSSTSYNTSSDYRLKENVVDMTNAVDRVKALKPSRFNFIGDEVTVDGFLAHEAQAVVPEAVTGEKDAVDKDGNPEYQGIDQAKLVPLLTGALQEAIARIETLEAEVATLKGN